MSRSPTRKTVVAPPGRLNVTIINAMDQSEGGVIVVDMKPDSILKGKIDIGDEIVTMNGSQINSIEDFHRSPDIQRVFGVMTLTLNNSGGRGKVRATHSFPIEVSEVSGSFGLCLNDDLVVVEILLGSPYKDRVLKLDRLVTVGKEDVRDFSPAQLGAFLEIIKTNKCPRKLGFVRTSARPKRTKRPRHEKVGNCETTAGLSAESRPSQKRKIGSTQNGIGSVSIKQDRRNENGDNSKTTIGSPVEDQARKSITGSPQNLSGGLPVKQHRRADLPNGKIAVKSADEKPAPKNGRRSTHIQASELSPQECRRNENEASSKNIAGGSPTEIAAPKISGRSTLNQTSELPPQQCGRANTPTGETAGKSAVKSPAAKNSARWSESKTTKPPMQKNKQGGVADNSAITVKIEAESAVRKESKRYTHNQRNEMSLQQDRRANVAIDETAAKFAPEYPTEKNSKNSPQNQVTPVYRQAVNLQDEQIRRLEAPIPKVIELREAQTEPRPELLHQSASPPDDRSAQLVSLEDVQAESKPDCDNPVLPEALRNLEVLITGVASNRLKVKKAILRAYDMDRSIKKLQLALPSTQECRRAHVLLSSLVDSEQRKLEAILELEEEKLTCVECNLRRLVLFKIENGHCNIPWVPALPSFRDFIAMCRTWYRRLEDAGLLNMDVSEMSDDDPAFQTNFQRLSFLDWQENIKLLQSFGFSRWKPVTV